MLLPVLAAAPLPLNLLLCKSNDTASSRSELLGFVQFNLLYKYGFVLPEHKYNSYFHYGHVGTWNINTAHQPRNIKYLYKPDSNGSNI